MKRAALTLACALLLASPAAAAMQQYSMQVNGVTRTLWMELPKCYLADRSYAVVMVLHGGMGDGKKVAQQTGLPSYSVGKSCRLGGGGFIAVYPNGLYNVDGPQWNDGRAMTSGGADDVGFLSALIDAVVANYRGDPARKYLAGGSSGGMMAQRMARERASKFQAYTVAIAGMPADLTSPSTGSARMNIYASTTDPYMPFEGGTARRGFKVWSNKATVDYWAKVNGCTDLSPVVQTMPKIVNDGTSVLYSRYACGVDRYQVVGGDHSWPTGNLNGTQAMLRFFGLGI